MRDKSPFSLALHLINCAEQSTKSAAAANHIDKQRLGSTDDCGFSPFSIDMKPSHGTPDYARDVAFQKIKKSRCRYQNGSREARCSLRTLLSGFTSADAVFALPLAYFLPGQSGMNRRRLFQDRRLFVLPCLHRASTG